MFQQKYLTYSTIAWILSSDVYIERVKAFSFTLPLRTLRRPIGCEQSGPPIMYIYTVHVDVTYNSIYILHERDVVDSQTKNSLLLLLYLLYFLLFNIIIFDPKTHVWLC